MLTELRALRTALGVEAARPPPPSVLRVRGSDARHAVVVVHGASGGFDRWAPFVDRLLQESPRADQDVYRVAYPVPLRVDLLTPWSGDPDLERCASQLAAVLEAPPLQRYETLSLVAHSLAGLVVQRAIVDDAALRRRLGHVVLYATPSDGLRESGPGVLIKPQWPDLRRGSPFLSTLRARWRERVGDDPPFSVRVVAGLQDVFVDVPSSLGPFPEDQVEVVGADHLQVVASQPGFEIVSALLSGVERGARPGGGALLAYIRGERRRALDALLPCAAPLDEELSAVLALLLDEFGPREKALPVLDRHSSQAGARLVQLGVLADLYKHRWLQERAASDRARAEELYGAGLALAEAEGNWPGAARHAVNAAFLQLMATSMHLPAPASARALADRALAACEHVSAERRPHGVRGEALLILGHLPQAVEAYAAAARVTEPGRDCDALYLQAIQAARRMFGEQGALLIQRAFGVSA